MARQLAFSRFSFESSAACLGISLCFSPTAAWSHSTATGTASGQVTNSTNAIVAAALVQLLDIATKVILGGKSSATSAGGKYDGV